MNCLKSVYYFVMYRASYARQLQYSYNRRPGVDCVQVKLTPHLSALQEVFSDWRSVVWYIYGDFCADRCIVFIVTFLYWTWSQIACYHRCLSAYRVKRETCAICCHDNSGSSDLKCVVYHFVGLSLSFVFWQFCCDLGDIFEVAGGEGYRELCNYKLFKNSRIQFAIIDWCQCFLFRSTFPPLNNRRTLILPPPFVINKLAFPVTPSPDKLRQ